MLPPVHPTASDASPAGPRHAGGADFPFSPRDYAALELISQPVWLFDIDHRRVLWANQPALQVWKASSLAELQARDLGRDMSSTVAHRLAQYQRDFEAHDAVFAEQWTLYPAGHAVSLNVRFSGHRLSDGRMAMLCEGRPVHAHAPDSVRAVEALLHTTLMISLYDLEGRPLYRNPAARDSTCRPDECLPKRLVDTEDLALLQETLSSGGGTSLTLRVHTPQGVRWHEVTARRCRDAVSGQDAVLVSEADVTAIKDTEARARYLALHDPLTGLPNRTQVMARFADALRELGAAGAEAAVVFIDLDNFKDINDTLGHAAGDELLVSVARRLRDATRTEDLVARLGGDEFMILLRSPNIRCDVDHAYRRIATSLTAPLDVRGVEVRITPSIGVSLYPEHAVDIETLLRHADLAMYGAKAEGRNRMVLYTESMGVALRARTSLEAELRLALERGEFEVHYQPRMAVRNRSILGAEALVRWRHPVHGLVGPDVFIPMSERLGLIGRLGMFVFETAVRQQTEWAARGHDLQISVNLSPLQLADPHLVTRMAAVLARFGCPPSRIELEVTESMLLGHEERPIAVLQAIQALGMSIALDDFGTGYSNLAYLQRYPLHTLKIDKTFIQAPDADRPLAEMIVSLCRLLKLNVVAEGVETSEQLDWVAGREIAEYQGYHFSPPLPVSRFEALLEEAAV